MTLHVFNPEHDIALASNLSNFTAPHAGRQLRHDLGFLPLLWAHDGDAVWVDDADYARKAWRRTEARLRTLMGDFGLNLSKNVDFVEKQRLATLSVDQIDPWGWDSALNAALARYGVGKAVLPTDDELADVRRLSHRQVAAQALSRLCRGEDGRVGEAYVCHRPDEVESLLSRYGQVVMKAPWSSSGRGLRFLSTERTPLSQQAGWLRNLLAAQGSVMVEPYYDKVKDFGMEFVADGRGRVDYLGLSLFHTANGAYVGNVLATEARKTQELSRLIAPSRLETVRQELCQLLGELVGQTYRGPLGVDMMLCASAEPGAPLLLHPCVEINLRRTMGHAALALTPTDDDLRLVMRIEYGENYKLTIHKL